MKWMHPLTVRPANIVISGHLSVVNALSVSACSGLKERHACRSLYLLHTEILSVVNGVVLAGVISCWLFGACVLFLRPGDTFPCDSVLSLPDFTSLLKVSALSWSCLLPCIPGCFSHEGRWACKSGECVNMRSAISGRNKAFSESSSSVTVLVQNFTQDKRYCNSAKWLLGLEILASLDPGISCPVRIITKFEVIGDGKKPQKLALTLIK